MSKSWFPDLLGPSRVAANGASSVGIRRKVLNLITGATAVDNPGRRRIDLTIPPADWTVYTATTSSAGEWYPASTTLSTVDVVRVSSSVVGTALVGLDSDVDPVKLVKYVANLSTSVAITLRPPTGPASGTQQYFAGDPYTLNPNSTVRVVWDVIDHVYRIKGTSSAPPVTDHILLGGNTIVLGSNPLSNPL